MQSLYDQQLAEATRQDGSVDLDTLSTLIVNHYKYVSDQNQAELLRTVLESVVQGICLFNKEHHLVICNQRYAELYGLCSGQVEPGTTLREVVEARYLVGSTPAMTSAAYLAWRDEVTLLSKAHTSTIELQNGRVIVIRHQPMADGGWVATHEDVTDRQKTWLELVYLERHVAATGLPNRKLITEQIDEILRCPTRTEAFTVLSINLGGVHEVNRTVGQPESNRLLAVLLGRLQSCLRSSDLLGQLNANEFIVMLTCDSQLEEVTYLAQRLVRLMSEPVALVGQSIVVRASIGIAAALPLEQGAEVLIHNAGIAMHWAKMSGGNAIRLFEPEMDTLLKERRLLETDLRDAVDRMSFEIHYQPQFNLTTRRLIGFEALIRWTHSIRGTVAPNVFIPLAETTGLITRIGQWVLEQACAQAACWPDDVVVAVNVSALQLNDGSLPGVVDKALVNSKLPASRLELEVTETSMLSNRSAAAAVLSQVREFGVKIALDDFGTGYSSLSHLASLPFDKLKIDRSLVSKLGEGASHTAIIRSIISLCSSLDIICIAEGVETQAQLAVLINERCPEVQGYLLGRPGLAEDIPGLLRELEAQQAVRFETSAQTQVNPTANLQGGKFPIPVERIVETANDVIIVTEARLAAPGPQRLHVNPAFSRLIGYLANEATGASPRILQGFGTSRDAELPFG